MRHGPLKRPREPAPSDCCGSGCTRCVWDVYFDDLAEYEERVVGAGSQDGVSEADDENGCETSSGEEDEEPFNYVGSVIVKYIDSPADQSCCVTPKTAMSAILGCFYSVLDVEMVASSSCGASVPCAALSGDQDIHVINVLLGATNESQGQGASPQPLPGDVVEVFYPNDHDLGDCDNAGEVESLCCRLGVSPNQWCELHRSPFVPPGHFPPWLPLQQPVQIRTLLAYFVDIGSCSYILRPTFLQTLLRVATSAKGVCSDPLTPKEKDLMELLKVCGSEAVAPAIYKAVMGEKATFCFPRLVDVLEVFRFVNLPLARLLEVGGPLRPRKFSVVNYTVGGALEDDREKRLCSVQLCLRSVDVSGTEVPVVTAAESAPEHMFAGLLRDAAQRRCATGEGSRGPFTGHVSHPLCNFYSRRRALPLYVGTRLFGTSSFATNLRKAMASVTSSSELFSPLARPLVVLVGAGSGIAPLMSAVNELVRRCRAASAAGRYIPNCWVVYGARNFSELVYHNQLKEALRLGAISRYDIALSRSNDGGYPKYVTDILESQAELLRSELLERGGWLFACGPLRVMKSLRERTAANILSVADDDESVGEQRVRLLERTEHLVFDVWGAVNPFE